MREAATRDARRPLRRTATLLVFLSAAGALRAESGGGEAPSPASAFESTVVEFEAMPEARSIPVEWTYVNRWDFPLAVERVEESCGCLSGPAGNSETEPVAPGESGVIRATFTPGPYRGTVRKSLRVRFAGHADAVELVGVATIPSTVELSTQQLEWTTDGDAAARAVEVTAGTGADFRITGLTGVAANRYRVERETIVEGRHYRITVTPAGDPGETTETLLVRTDSPDPRDRVQAVFLAVKSGVREPSRNTPETPAAADPAP